MASIYTVNSDILEAVTEENHRWPVRDYPSPFSALLYEGSEDWRRICVSDQQMYKPAIKPAHMLLSPKRGTKTEKDDKRLSNYTSCG